ncbi:MAG: TadE/TadG family type IV pilus assembly protein [Acidobacteriota bacterium]
MVPHTHSTLRRRRRSAGNTFVEGAFTLLPTFALIFAFLDFGLMLFRWSTLQNAVREGARYAITFQQQTVGPSTLGQSDSIKNIVEQYSFGTVHVNDNPQHIFVKYYATTAPTTPIPSGGNVPGNIVEVSVQNVSLAWLAPLSGSYSSAVAPFFRNSTPLTLSVYSSDILGGLPVGVPSVAE